MSYAEIELKGFNELKKVLRDSPHIVVGSARSYFQRVMAEMERVLVSSPWQVGGRGGGVPVATGYLRSQAVNREFKDYYAKLYTDLSNAYYGVFVHEGTRKMKARPYYDYAYDKSAPKTKEYQDKFLKEIVESLAK